MTSQKNESSLMRRYVSAVVRHRLIVITCVIIVTILLASRLMSLKIDMDQDTWVPQAHPYVKTTKQIEKVFGGRNVTIIGIVPKQGDIYQPNILAKIQRIQAGIEQIPGAIRHNVASLAARKIKDIKGTADGMVVTRMLETVPQTPEELAKLRQTVEENPIYINALVSPDGKSAAVIADFKVDTSKPSYALLYEEIRKVTDLEADNTVDIYFGGLPIDFAWFEQHMMKMPLYFGIALLIIMVIQYWSFRSIQGMLLPILTALLSVVWSLGIMGAVGVHMDGMNTTTPILIMAMAAGHSIQILKRYYEEYHRLSLAAAPESSKRALSNAAVIESIVRVGPVMITAGVIAAITFYSLVASGVSAAQHFGVFAGSGVLSAMVLEMTLVPAMRSLLPPPSQREKDRERRHDLLDRLLLSMADRLTGGRAPVILLVSTAVVLLVFSGVYRLQVDNSLKH